MQHILVVGGGFAGLWAALGAARRIDGRHSDISISVVSADPYLTIRPRLYESNPESLRVPLRDTLDAVDVAVIEGVVTEIDCHAKQVACVPTEGTEIALNYDRLILAAGSTQKQLPVPGVAKCTWNVDTHTAAVALDSHLRSVAQNPDAPGNDSIVIVGGGFTGIELATEMYSRLANHSDAGRAAAIRVILVEAAEEIGPDLGANPRPDIQQALQTLNVEVRTATRAIGFETGRVTLSDGSVLATNTVIVTAGLQANELVDQFPVEKDSLGRLPVDDTLHVLGVADTFAAGDVARASVDDANVALMSCQHAMPMGRYAGYNAASELLELPLRAYRQPDYVTCLDLGSAGAVFTRGWDRQVELRGEDAKRRKKIINTEWIYPPVGARQEILEAADLEQKRRR